MSKILIVIVVLFLSVSSLYAQTEQDYCDKGRIDARKGNFTQAISDYTKAIAIKPDSVKGYAGRGYIYFKQGEPNKAIIDFNKAIGINPKYAYAFYFRAQSYYQLKEYDKAWADIHKAKELGDTMDPEFISRLEKASGR